MKKRPLRALRQEEAGPPQPVPDPVGDSEPMTRLLLLVRDLAGFDDPVVFSGEPGSGRETCARALHAWSPRSQRGFWVLNCARLSPDSFRESLVGSSRHGAEGLLAKAAGGALFLRDFHAVDPSLLQELCAAPGHPAKVKSPAGVRLLGSTEPGLEASLPGARTLIVPPLSERPRDIPLLALHFLDECAWRLRIPLPELTPQGAAALVAQGWPGNARQLREAVESLCVLAAGRPIDARDVERLLTAEDAEPPPLGLAGSPGRQI